MTTAGSKVTLRFSGSRQQQSIQWDATPLRAHLCFRFLDTESDRSLPQRTSRTLVDLTSMLHLLNDHSLLRDVETSTQRYNLRAKTFSNCFEHFCMALCMAVNTVKADSR